MHRPLAVCAALLLLAGCAHEPEPVADAPVAEAPVEEAPVADGPVADAPVAPDSSGLPRDVADVVERLEGCTHFAGEVGDNDPERTAQIEAAMDDLRCEEIDADVARVRAAHAGDTAVEEALRAATELF